MKPLTVLMLILISFFIGLTSCGSDRTDCRVAVAANMQFAMDELILSFMKQTGKRVRVSSASSGQLYSQISKGAPFDLFLSADEAFPQRVLNDGKALSKPIVYAEGKLIVWTQKNLELDADLKALLNPEISRIAIANPESAPYGRAAKEALKTAGVWGQIESKIIYGQSISQVNHYVNVKAVDCGITALSAISHLNEKSKGQFTYINDALYSPIKQSMILVKSRDKPSQDIARIFFEYIQSQQAKTILRQHGFKIDIP